MNIRAGRSHFAGWHLADRRGWAGEKLASVEPHGTIDISRSCCAPWRSPLTDRRHDPSGARAVTRRSADLSPGGEVVKTEDPRNNNFTSRKR